MDDEDGAKALALLRRFDRVTVLNGHIHQVVRHQDGNIAFASAAATTYPQPAPGTAPKPGPLTLPQARYCMRSATEVSNCTIMDPPSSQSTRSADAAERHALEAAFVAREAWAFEAAYEAYRRHLYGAALAVLHDGGNAQDCVHDVLLRLWRHGHAYSHARGSSKHFSSCACATRRSRVFASRKTASALSANTFAR